jgi:hypothetical protein
MKRPVFFLFILPLLLVASGASLLFADDFPSFDYPESSDIRLQILPEWLTGELNRVRLLKPAFPENLYGDRFEVSQKTDKVRGLVSVTVRRAPLRAAEKKGAEGEWTLWRTLADGMPVRISLYPVPDKNIRIDFRPEGSNPEKGRSYLDLVVYGAIAVHDAPVGIPFTNLYTVPLSSIVALTAKTVPWDLLSPDLHRYGDSASAVSTIRDRLKTLVYLDDGAFDEKGNAVMRGDRAPQDPAKVWESLGKNQKASEISGGVDFAGFAKWIVDGIIEPGAGEGTHIDPLLTRTIPPSSDFEEPGPDNPFFALDWTRNLASAVVSLDRRKAVKADSSGVDVAVSVFSDSCVYQKNVGYRTRELAPLLYWLAVREPGYLYLGAVCRQNNVPPVPSFFGIAVFFPYFKEDGSFAVAVFENARETTLDAFIAQNGGSFTNFARVRIPESDRFDP